MVLDSCVIESQRNGLPGEVSSVQVRLETVESVSARRRISWYMMDDRYFARL
jgi:hypothetical protein